MGRRNPYLLIMISNNFGVEEVVGLEGGHCWLERGGNGKERFDVGLLVLFV